MSPISTGCGPPRNSVTITSDIVMTFMNSARKNRAKRKRGVLGVEAADQFLLGLDEVERRPVELGRGGDQEDHERHDAGRAPRSSRRGRSGRCTMPDVDSVPDVSSTAATLSPSAAS